MVVNNDEAGGDSEYALLFTCAGIDIDGRDMDGICWWGCPKLAAFVVVMLHDMGDEGMRRSSTIRSSSSISSTSCQASSTMLFFRDLLRLIEVEEPRHLMSLICPKLNVDDDGVRVAVGVLQWGWVLSGISTRPGLTVCPCMGNCEKSVWAN